MSRVKCSKRIFYFRDGGGVELYRTMQYYTKTKCSRGGGGGYGHGAGRARNGERGECETATDDLRTAALTARRASSTLFFIARGGEGRGALCASDGSQQCRLLHLDCVRLRVEPTNRLLERRDHEVRVEGLAQGERSVVEDRTPESHSPRARRTRATGQGREGRRRGRLERHHGLRSTWSEVSKDKIQKQNTYGRALA